MSLVALREDRLASPTREDVAKSTRARHPACLHRSVPPSQWEGSRPFHIGSKECRLLESIPSSLGGLCRRQSLASTGQAAGASRDPARGLLGCIRVRHHAASERPPLPNGFRKRANGAAAQLKSCVRGKRPRPGPEGGAGHVLTRSSKRC